MSTQNVKIILGNKEYVLRNGYLDNWRNWDTDFATHMAKKDGINITAFHFEYIHFLRNHFAEAHRNPIEKALLRIATRMLGRRRGSEEYFRSLFPKGGDQLACWAGLRRPGGCPFQ